MKAGTLRHPVSIWNPPAAASTGEGEYSGLGEFAASRACYFPETYFGGNFLPQGFFFSMANGGWTKLANAWAEIIDVSAIEAALVEGAREFVMTKRIRIRSNATIRSGLSSKSAIIDGSKVYYVIEYLDPEGRGRELQILAKEKRASA